ncbi:MAG: AraC family transcriptional regulator [Bifidobacterium sp.]|uniref:helix-turn-helix domain-containing protein n=2 Tax=Bifidobacterium sp. TaxID=41200 RepID=UPI0039E7C096
MHKMTSSRYTDRNVVNISSSGMDMYAGYLYAMDNDVASTSLPLVVSACGHYRMVTRNEFSTLRPYGRKDFQLLYVHGGEAVFYKRGEPHRLSAGSMVVFFPDEPQRYEYGAEDRTDVYWIHFSGTQASRLLEAAGFGAAGRGASGGARELSCSGIMRVGQLPEYAQLFSQTINELQLQGFGFESIVQMNLRRLLLLIRRQRLGPGEESGRERSGKIQSAITYFHRHYPSDINIDAYAHDHGMSVSWFIRSFREASGKSPLRYLIDIRIREAKLLLETTSYSIGEVADMVGYANPLYFSRLFRSHVGMSPSQYRNSTNRAMSGRARVRDIAGRSSWEHRIGPDASVR